MILRDFFEDEKVNDRLSSLEEKVVSGEMSSFQAAELIYELYRSKK